MFNMKSIAKQKLVLEQLDAKLSAFNSGSIVKRPDNGWLAVIRKALNMTLQQFGNRLDTTAQGAKALEEREANGSITLNALKEAAAAVDMQLVYALVPKDGSLEALIEKKATMLAQQIVMRTSASMKLEDQENSSERLQKAIREKATELKNELPKYLWE